MQPWYCNTKRTKGVEPRLGLGPRTSGLRHLGEQVKIHWQHLNQGVTKSCRLFWLTNIANIYEPKCGWRGEVAGSQLMNTAVHRSSNKFWRSNSIFNLWYVLYCYLYIRRGKNQLQVANTIRCKDDRIYAALSHYIHWWRDLLRIGEMVVGRVVRGPAAGQLFTSARIPSTQEGTTRRLSIRNHQESNAKSLNFE